MLHLMQTVVLVPAVAGLSVSYSIMVIKGMFLQNMGIAQAADHPMVYGTVTLP